MVRRWMKIVPVVAAFGAGALAAMAVGQPAGPGVKNQGEPGPQHTEFTKLAGEYITASKLYISSGDEAFESGGTAKVTSILDGRFITIDEQGETLGNAFKSLKIWGYNAAAGKYESVWLYTGSTAMTTLNGKTSDGGKAVKLDGSFEDTDGKTKYSVEFSRTDGGFKITQVALNGDGSAGVKIDTEYKRK